MSQHQQMISLDSIVNDYLNEAELSNHRYFKIWHIMFGLMDDLGLDFFYQIKSIKLPVNPNATVTLPADYLNWTKVGYLNNIGEVAPLKYNENLTTFGDLLPDRAAKVTGNSVILNFYSPSSPTFFNYYNVNNGGYGNLYGLPTTGSYGGQFKVDETNGVILLDTYWVWSDLMLEYRASPMEGQEYYVPMHFRKTLIAGAWWVDKKAINVKRGAVGINRDLERTYWNERRLAVARYRPFNLDQAYLASVEATRLTVKS